MAPATTVAATSASTAELGAATSEDGRVKSKTRWEHTGARALRIMHQAVHGNRGVDDEDARRAREEQVQATVQRLASSSVLKTRHLKGTTTEHETLISDQTV